MAKRKPKIRSATQLELDQLVEEWLNLPESNRAGYDKRRVADGPRTKAIDLEELSEISERLQETAEQFNSIIQRLLELGRPGIMADGVATLLKQLYGIERRAKLMYGSTLPLCHWEDRLTNDG